MCVYVCVFVASMVYSKMGLPSWEGEEEGAEGSAGEAEEERTPAEVMEFQDGRVQVTVESLGGGSTATSRTPAGEGSRHSKETDKEGAQLGEEKREQKKGKKKVVVVVKKTTKRVRRRRGGVPTM